MIFDSPYTAVFANKKPPEIKPAAPLTPDNPRWRQQPGKKKSKKEKK